MPTAENAKDHSAVVLMSKGLTPGKLRGLQRISNPNGTLTMVFSGYSTPKPLPTAGAVLGTGATKWTVGTEDPALYRDILTVTLTPDGDSWRTVR